MSQLTFDYTQRVENTNESNSILQANKKRINRRCEQVLSILRTGKRLTVLGAAIEYGITSLPRRIKDLRDMKGIPIKDRLIDGKFKEYFL